MRDNIKFSIIIPVYNVQMYLEQCIRSVSEQTYEDYELILVDDGSTDQSGLLCDEYARKDKRICVIHQKNGGSSAARNRGIDAASGEYIIFLDSDDCWKEKDVLEKLYDRLRETNSDVLSFNYVKFQGNVFETPYFSQTGDMPANLKENETLNYLVQQNLWIACAWNKAIKKELFAENDLRFQVGITSEDIDWCLRLAIKAKSFDYINDAVVCYRQRRTSISNNMTAEKIDMLLNNIDVCLELLKDNAEKAQILRPYVAYQYGTALHHTAAMNKHKEYKGLIRQLEQKKYMLPWSKNRKLRMIHFADAIGGMKLVMFLLRLRQNKNSIKEKDER